MRIKNLWFLFTKYLGATVLHPQFIIKKLQEETLIEIKKYARGKLIDIGCGRMPYRKELETMVDSYIGVDHPEISKLYKSNLKPEVLADAKKLPFRNNTFDIGLLLQVLEHVENPKAVIKEAARVLKPNGILIISLPFLYPLHDLPYDYGRYTSSSLKNFCSETGFDIIKIKSQGGFFEFWLQSLNTFLLKRINDIIASKLGLFSFVLLFFIIVISLPVILFNNLLVMIINLISFIFPKYPNYFPLDYLVISVKKRLFNIR